MARTTQTYVLNIAANASVDLLVEGTFYKVTAASGDLKVAREGGNAVGPILPGQGERQLFRKLVVTDLSGLANTVSILVGDETFIDSRIYGNVNVIDGGRLITQAGNSFVGMANVGAGVGLFSQIQLWNPAANTKWACVKRVAVSSPTGTTTFSIRPHNVALPTSSTNPKQKNLLSGSSVGTMEMWTDQNAAVLGASSVGQLAALSNTPVYFDFNEPVLIPPGKGLIAANINANLSITANFDFYEFTP